MVKTRLQSPRATVGAVRNRSTSVHACTFSERRATATHVRLTDARRSTRLEAPADQDRSCLIGADHGLASGLGARPSVPGGMFRVDLRPRLQDCADTRVGYKMRWVGCKVHHPLKQVINDCTAHVTRTRRHTGIHLHERTFDGPHPYDHTLVKMRCLQPRCAASMAFQEYALSQSCRPLLQSFSIPFHPFCRSSWENQEQEPSAIAL